MLSEIVGFRMPISRIESKFKLSPVERRAIQDSHAAGTADQQALAAWMKRIDV